MSPQDGTLAAAVLERLLVDDEFRARFRRAPAATLEHWGMHEVARELRQNGPALRTLHQRESRSSLAGVLMAAAVEGVAVFSRVQQPDELAPDARVALTQALRKPSVRRMTAALPSANPVHRTLLHDRRHAGPPERHEAPDHEPVAPEPSLLEYPGDDAPRERLAAWMGAYAKRAGLPPELPVMAALQESSLRNLDGGDADSVGFFQMRVSIWDSGAYRGYADRPALQMKWFVDHALQEKGKHPELARSPGSYGEWIANVERPAEQYRGLYARHLAEARRLIDAGSADARRVHGEVAADAAARPRGARTGVHAAPDAADAVDGGAPVSLPKQMLSLAEKEIGQQEHPPGSNDSDRITHYREATPGGPVGPWCAYFVSWVSHEAGVPLGDHGQGFASVDALWAWAQQSGHAVPAGGAARPGDLIVWDEHVGIVERVDPDGTIHTIEGNTSDQVARRVHSPSGVVGFVRLRR